MKKFFSLCICTLIFISTFGISQHEANAATTSKSYMMNKEYIYKYKTVDESYSSTGYVYYKYSKKTKHWQQDVGYGGGYTDSFKEVFNSKGIYQYYPDNINERILPKTIKKNAKWSYSYVMGDGKTTKVSSKITSTKGKVGKYKNCIIVRIGTTYQYMGKMTTDYRTVYYAKGIGRVKEINGGYVWTLVSAKKR